MRDVINPDHYTSLPAKCECGQKIECITITRHFDFLLGNVIKYVWRCNFKDSALEDLRKARWYLNAAISQLEAKALVTKEEKR